MTLMAELAVSSCGCDIDCFFLPPQCPQSRAQGYHIGLTHRQDLREKGQTTETFFGGKELEFIALADEGPDPAERDDLLI